MTDYDFVWLSEAVLGNRKIQISIGLAEKAAGTLLKYLDRLGILKSAPKNMFTAANRFRREPTASTKEPVRGRMAVYKNKNLLAARGMSAEGDYNSTTLATVIFCNSFETHQRQHCPTRTALRGRFV